MQGRSLHRQNQLLEGDFDMSRTWLATPGSEALRESNYAAADRLVYRM